jgi:hypothetical protein
MKNQVPFKQTAPPEINDGENPHRKYLISPKKPKSEIILPLPRSQVLNQSLNAFVFLPGDKYNYKLTSGHITAYILILLGNSGNKGNIGKSSLIPKYPNSVTLLN